MAHPGHKLTCAKLRRRRRREGCCPRCGRPLAEGRCPPCLERAKAYQAAKRVARRRGGWCVRCPAGRLRKALGQGWRCYECQENHYEAERARREAATSLPDGGRQ